MILLHASTELKAVFQKVIKNMGVNVAWDGVFAVTFNNLILLGKVRSLFFNFDNKKANTNIIDIDITEGMLNETSDYEHLNNVINMTLYAFGKWGAIKGLKVEQDYAKLNGLFRGILLDIRVEPSFRDDNFRFFKDKIQITYEDVIQEILDLSNTSELENMEEPAEEVVSEGEGHKLGLWHNMTWKIAARSFRKEQRLEDEAVKSRLGNEFYMVDYKCPDCGEKMYMALFPVDKEFLIETAESRVYLARVYACDGCNCFYTPRPGKLLQEGDVYILDFEDDRSAYKDYLELMGRQGSGSANYKFNEYESERNKREPMETLSEICDTVETMSEEEWDQVNEKMNSGFYSPAEVKRIKKAAERRFESGNRISKTTDTGFGKKENGKISKEKAEKQNKKVKKENEFSLKTIDELKEMRRAMESGNHAAAQKGEILASLDEMIEGKIKEKFDAHMAVLDRMSKKQLSDLKLKIQSEPVLEEKERRTYLEKVNQIFFKQEEKNLEQKVDACKEKSYVEINRLIEEIQGSSISEERKKSMLAPLLEARKIRGQKEVDVLISHIPSRLNKKQLNAYREKLAQYQDVDTSPYQKQLDLKADLAEQTDIREFIKRTDAKDRSALLRLSEQLKKQGFSEQNIAPYLEDVHDKIYALDEAAIQKICPDILSISFEDGLKAYKEIAEGIFLPELKTNTLDMLDRRLTKMKMDENEQLVRKLQKDMDKSVKDFSNLYFYESRKMMRGDVDDKELGIINRAMNSYASSRSKYEFPILISDASRLPNGKEGFVLTPDHIYYRTLLTSGSIPVLEVEDVTAAAGLLNKGIYANRKLGKKVKLPNKISAGEWSSVTESISRFIEYLREKPESRNVSYLQKEKHEVKCCYRCGHTFTSGDTCPKCGSKANH